MKRILACMLDESEFLSSYGLRSLSRYHREHPLIVNTDGHDRWAATGVSRRGP